MSDFIDIKQQQESLLSSVLDMVRASDGDFTAIGQLGKASSDRETLQLMVNRISLHPQGKKAFESHARLGVIDLEELRKLSENTLGYLYAEHMLSNQIKPLQTQPAENDYQFLGTHIAETHDIWHVVTGSKIDILGEIQLEAFYVAQLEVSRFWLALLTKNLLKALVYDIEIATQYMEALTKGWIMGKKAEPLFGVDWNTLWDAPIELVRDSFNITDV
jgi:ubiquinone biosynthesis protein COQ4